MPDRRLLTDGEIPEAFRQFKPHLLGRERRDNRDHRASAVFAPADSFPRSVVLPRISPVRDQVAVGSCVGMAVTAMLENYAYRQSGQAVQLSPLHAYYLGRLIDGSVPVDCGTFVRSALKGIRKYGVAPEPFWTYDGYSRKFVEMPDAKARLQAVFQRGFQYVSLSTMDEMRYAIASGYGFAAIVTLFESWFSNAWIGTIPDPQPFEGARGAHALFFCGYDDDTQRFIVKNSWGKQVADGGYFSVPYSYVTMNELWDAWTVAPLV